MLNKIVCFFFGHRSTFWTHSHFGQEPPFNVSRYCKRCNVPLDMPRTALNIAMPKCYTRELSSSISQDKQGRRDVIDLHKGELIAESSGTGWNQELSRLRVDGGWLYVCQVNSARGIAVTSTYVPDSKEDSLSH